MNTFGDYISRLRNYSKMTQEQLAEKMEVSKTTIQNWESGRTKVKPTHLKRLAYQRFFLWVMSYGDGIELLSPVKTRSEYLAEVRKMHGAYPEFEKEEKTD